VKEDEYGLNNRVRVMRVLRGNWEGGGIYVEGEGERDERGRNIDGK